MKNEAMTLLVDGSRGVYIWQHLAGAYELFVEHIERAGIYAYKEYTRLQYWLDAYAPEWNETAESVFDPANENWLENVDSLEDRLYIRDSESGEYYGICQLDGDIWAIHPDAEWNDETETFELEN